MTKVLIAKTTDVKTPKEFCYNNGFYDDYQYIGIGITEFGKALIDLAIENSDAAQWAIKHTTSKYYVKRVEHDRLTVAYNIFIDLSNENLTFWNLKYRMVDVYQEE